MMVLDFPGGSGNIEGPVSPHNYKRAVYRQAPSRFTVEMLGAEKQGGNYSFGMRICPIPTNDRLSITSRSSHSEYDVWRRWEDCLWFQETIEMEYERLARQKKQRLIKGKGVKKNGMYLQDQAASFESLPPGPDPNSVAQSIHDTVPKLTKKGTLFRASQATIDQRQRELTALVEGLFKDDVPMLIQELREARIVTDFFGYWRRDYDLDLKKPSKSSKPRNSVTSSVLSMYFSQSNPNLSVPTSTLPPIPQSPSVITVRSKRSQSSPANPISSMNDLSSLASNLSSDDDTIHRPRPRLSSQSSSCSSSSRDSQGSIVSSTSFILPDDASIVIDHNGKLPSDYPLISNRPTSRGLEALPEDAVLPSKGDGGLVPPSAAVRPRRKSSAADSNRICHIYGTPPASARTSLDTQSNSPRRRERESILSVASGTSIIDNLSIMLPSEDGLPVDRRARDSVSSIATFMTSNSAEAIIPLSLPSSASQRRPPSRLRPFSTTDVDEEDDFIDPYLYDEFPMPQMMESPPRSRYAPPSQNQSPLRPQTASSTRSTQSTRSSLLPPSPTDSTFTSISASSQSPSVSSSVSPYDSYSVKAAFNSTIILLRVPCGASLEEFRYRLFNKFADQDIALPVQFVLFLVIPSSPVSNPRVRDRSNSLASVLTVDQSRMRVVNSEQDWDVVVSSLDGSKLTFRIMHPSCIS